MPGFIIASMYRIRLISVVLQRIIRIKKELKGAEMTVRDLDEILRSIVIQSNRFANFGPKVQEEIVSSLMIIFKLTQSVNLDRFEIGELANC